MLVSEWRELMPGDPPAEYADAPPLPHFREAATEFGMRGHALELGRQFRLHFPALTGARADRSRAAPAPFANASRAAASTERRS
jgi:hypothetical protein